MGRSGTRVKRKVRVTVAEGMGREWGVEEEEIALKEIDTHASCKLSKELEGRITKRSETSSKKETRRVPRIRLRKV